MPLTTYFKNKMLDQAIGGGSAITVYASLHSSSPGSTGANELTGGTPAYARVALSWSAAASGAKSTSAVVTFNVPTGGVGIPGVVAYVGYWDAATSGNFLGYSAVTPVSYPTQDIYALTAAQLNLSAVAAA